MAEKARCRSCGAQIIWATTAAGHVIPLDAEPVENGNISLADGKAIVVDKGSLFETVVGGPYYQSHFASCKDAEKWRKRKEKK